MDKHNDELWKQVVTYCVAQDVKIALDELEQDKELQKVQQEAEMDSVIKE